MMETCLAGSTSSGNWDALYKVIDQKHNTDGVHSVADMVTGGSVIDDDTFATASATTLATSESIKNFVGNGWTPALETWTYASADDPTYTFTISGDLTDKYSAGMRIKLTQTTAKYFIITKVAYSSPNTTITVYGGTDYDLANATITNPYYSVVKAPQGFPLDPVVS